MSGLRVLFCTLGYPPGPVGGAERQAALQAAELSRRGHRVTIVCPASPGARSGPVDGIMVRRLPRLNRRLLRTLTYLPVLLAWLLVRVREFDVVHVHLANLQADVAAVACRIARRPLYVKLAAGGRRGEVRRMTPVAPVTRRIGLRWATRLQAISEEIEADLLGIGMPAGRIVRIPNGLDGRSRLPPSPAERLRARARLGLPPDGLVVLFAGRFAGYKGVPDLVAAWSVPPQPGATLLLVGEQALDDPSGPIPPLPGLIVRDWLPDPSPAFAAADVLVQPSHTEGMSNTVLEAMAHGLPILATRVGAAEEMLGPDAGWLVEPGSPRALRAALDDLLADEALRTRLGRAARQRVLDRYAIDAVADRIEAAYEEITSGGAG